MKIIFIIHNWKVQETKHSVDFLIFFVIFAKITKQL
jgi:hypothetical protein